MTNEQRAWIDALRSGQYQQCKGALYDGHGYCCLGVAAKTLDYVFVKESLKEENWFYQDYNGLLRKGVLDRYTHKLLGIESTMQDFLAALNDKGTSFETIATFLEQFFTTGRPPGQNRNKKILMAWAGQQMRFAPSGIIIEEV